MLKATGRPACTFIKKTWKVPFSYCTSSSRCSTQRHGKALFFLQLQQRITEALRRHGRSHSPVPGKHASGCGRCCRLRREGKRVREGPGNRGRAEASGGEAAASPGNGPRGDGAPREGRERPSPGRGARSASALPGDGGPAVPRRSPHPPTPPDPDPDPDPVPVPVPGRAGRSHLSVPPGPRASRPVRPPANRRARAPSSPPTHHNRTAPQRHWPVRKGGTRRPGVPRAPAAPGLPRRGACWDP